MNRSGSTATYRRWSAQQEAALYAVFSAVAVLCAARAFYGSLASQIFHGSVSGDPYLSPSDWSAPLDDVFIHFDFARSIAQGAPFEWCAGNGYSSGNTSLLYPFVLAPGFALGFKGLGLMQFAATIACTSVFALLLAVRSVFEDLPRASTYVAPVVLLSVGALDWSFFSGMEVAFFMALWGLALVLWRDLVGAATEPPTTGRGGVLTSAVLVGFSGCLLVATRPEAIVLCLIFSASAALAVRRTSTSRALAVAALTFAPALLVLVVQGLVNRRFTGDFASAGALVKLEMNDPRMPAREVWNAWLFHVRYQFGRVTGYHLGNGLAVGSLTWALAAIPFFDRATRRTAIVLWAQAIAWVLFVALNGQVRWQNERYTMPALAIMLVAVSLGLAVAFGRSLAAAGRRRVAGIAARVLVAAAVLVLAVPLKEHLEGQIWFFGRAARNIRDQHVKVGRKIRHELPNTRRVLLGDAGAIPYASGLPALDIIGLGGYEGLPFARATRWGLAAAIELIEHIPPGERPDVFALYPDWWGELPLWFGIPVDGVSVNGNVICGGKTKVIYAAHFDALDGAGLPAVPLEDRDDVVDSLDVADLLSESPHRYRTEGAVGFVSMKLLPHPRDTTRELWDGGRILPPGSRATFELGAPSAGAAARLVLRTALPQPVSLRIQLDGVELAPVHLPASAGWLETPIPLPARPATSPLRVALSVERGELVLYHLWLVERR